MIAAVLLLLSNLKERRRMAQNSANVNIVVLMAKIICRRNELSFLMSFLFSLFFFFFRFSCLSTICFLALKGEKKRNKNEEAFLIESLWKWIQYVIFCKKPIVVIYEKQFFGSDSVQIVFVAKSTKGIDVVNCLTDHTKISY